MTLRDLFGMSFWSSATFPEGVARSLAGCLSQLSLERKNSGVILVKKEADLLQC